MFKPAAGRPERGIRLPGRVATLALATVASTWLASCRLEPKAVPESRGDEPPEPSHFLDADNTHARWSAAIPPVLTVPSGAVVEVRTKEASDGQITPSTTTEDLAGLDFGLIHPLTGPVYVEGARPGDVLAVTLHEIEIEGWGWASIIPGFGFLANEFAEPWLRGFEMAPGAASVRFAEGVTLPLAPFAGVMGVAPATDSMLVTIPRKATRYMIDYLAAEHGLSRQEAYVLCSLAGDLKITETVDVPHMLVSMHMPKSIFAAGPNSGS